MMTRKDPTQDMERPHFYSQFWIDVAGGKRDVTVDHSAEAQADTDIEDFGDDDFAAPVEVATKPAAKKPSKPEKKPEPVRPTFNSLADLANIDLLMKNSEQMEGEEGPDLETSAIDDLAPFTSEPEAETPVVTDFDTEEEAPEAALADEEDDFEDFDDFDEDEDEDEWGGGGGRKPGKGPKQPPRRPERRTRF